jgi:twinkle protein
MTEEKENTLPRGEFIELTDRRIPLEVCMRYGVTCETDDNGNTVKHFYPYSSNRTGEIVAVKTRLTDVKAFYWTGTQQHLGLFGQQLFPSGGTKRITVVEGELDALAVATINDGGDWPVVSVRSSSSASSDIRNNLQYLLQYEEIYLCFDGDTAGRKATEEVASLLPIEKTFIVRLDEGKDPCDYLKERREQEFRRAFFRAERYSPEDIFVLTKDKATEILKEHKNKESYTLPFEDIQDKMQGLRLEEMTLITADPKVGKSEYVREIEYYLIDVLVRIDHITEGSRKIGIIHIEDPRDRTILSLASKAVNKPFLEFVKGDQALIEKGIELITKDEKLVMLDRQGSFEPEELLNKARYLRLSHDCRVIVFDNLSMLFSGRGEKEEPKAIAKLVTDLKIMAKELGFHVIMIAHLNDDGKTLGSRAPMRVTDNWINLERDIENPDPDIRRVIRTSLKYCRYTGDTGPSGSVWLNPDTGRLEKYVYPFEFGEEDNGQES